MKKTSAKQAKKIEKRILAVVADLKKAKKARKIEHIEMAEKFLASLTAKLDVAAANLKAKKEKLIAAQEAWIFLIISAGFSQISVSVL